MVKDLQNIEENYMVNVATKIFSNQGRFMYNATFHITTKSRNILKVKSKLIAI